MFNPKKIGEHVEIFSYVGDESEVDVEIGSRTRGVNIRDSLMR